MSGDIFFMFLSGVLAWGFWTTNSELERVKRELSECYGTLARARMKLRAAGLHDGIGGEPL